MWYGSSVLRHGRSRPWRPVPRQQPLPEPPAIGRRRQSAAARSARVAFCLTGISYNSSVKIYTRTGDTGETSLFGGTRVRKDDPRVDAYGEVDELNAWLGLARASSIDPDARRRSSSHIQRDLFALGAQLADPADKIAAARHEGRRSATTTSRGSSS